MNIDGGKYWIALNWKRDHYICLNWLHKDVRHLGYKEIWYDGPNYTFGFWFFNLSWNFI